MVLVKSKLPSDPRPRRGMAGPIQTKCRIADAKRREEQPADVDAMIDVVLPVEGADTDESINDLE